MMPSGDIEHYARSTRRRDEKLRHASSDTVRRRLREAEKLQCGAMVGCAASPVVARGGSSVGPPTENLYLRLFSSPDYFTKVSGRISAWQGTGSSGKAAVQATVGFQPVEGTGINGNPTVSYAGSSRWLQVTDVTLGVFDIYVILKTSTASAIILEQSVSATAGNGNFLFTGVTEGSAVFRGGVGSSIHPNSTSWVADGNAALIRSGFGGTHASRILERDGATVAAGVSAYTGSPGVGTVTDHLNIGCRSGGTLGIFAEYGEILIYNAAPDSTRAAQILAWSRSYWGTP